MPGSLTRRAARLHDRTRRGWETAWGRVVDAYLHGLHDALLEGAADPKEDPARRWGPEDEAFAEGFCRAHGWTDAHAAAWDGWYDTLNAFFRRVEACDLTAWPGHLPRPPGEPSGLLDALYRAFAEADTNVPPGRAVSDAEALGRRLSLLLYGRAVRTLDGEPMPTPPPEPGVIRLPDGRRIRIVRAGPPGPHDDLGPTGLP